MADFSLAPTTFKCTAHVVSRTAADRVRVVLLSAHGVKALVFVESPGAGADFIERLLAGAVTLRVMDTRDASTLLDVPDAPEPIYFASAWSTNPDSDRTNPATATSTTMVVTRNRNELTYNDRTVVLRPREMELLLAIAHARGSIVSKSELLESVWNAPSTLKTRTVDTHVGTLRGRLRQLGVEAAIATHRGRGYTWTYALRLDIR